MGLNQQGIAPTELPRRRFIGKAKPGAALDHADPLPFRLVVPEPGWTGGQTGVNPLQSPLRRRDDHAAALTAGGRAGRCQQVYAVPVPIRGCRGGGGGALPPATTDLEAPLPRQGHHLMVVAAVAQGRPQSGLRLAERHKGIQSRHLGEKLLQIGFGHGPLPARLDPGLRSASRQRREPRPGTGRIKPTAAALR